MFDSLKSQLKDQDPKKRKAAAEQIGKYAKDKKFDQGLFQPLVALLNDKSKDVQAAASLALFWMAHHGVTSPEALPTIIKHLESPDGMIRHDMAGILESFARKDLVDSAAIPKLIPNLRHENPDTRAATVYCLGTLHKKGVATSSVLEELRKLSGDSDEGVKKAVQRTLG